MLGMLQEATESPQGYAVSTSEERKTCMRGALPLDATNLMLSRHAEAVYNLGLRVPEVRVCADTPSTEQSPAT